MTNDKDRIKNEFFYPQSHYHGEFTPEQLAFNANLQEFAQRVSIICSLETGGKVSTEEAYRQIRNLWKQLKQSKKALIDQPKPDKPELPDE
ncbi:MAG TPA: hypothetical protein V6C57_18545 [Coleofasciculaceae cyanobacterium]